MGSTMTGVQDLFLKILTASLHGSRLSGEEIGENFWQVWQEMKKIARQQAVSPLIYDYLLSWESGRMPEQEQQYLKQQEFVTAMMYYQMVNFVFMVLELLQKQKIQGCILKGVGMAGYYPREELRKAGDVDLYIPVPEEFEAFCKTLKENGFEREKSVTDHHRTYYYVSDGVKFELEVHIKPINTQENAAFNKEVDQIFAPFAAGQGKEFSKAEIINGGVLPPEENAFYLLLHMLQHMLSGGMGVRLLCDWVLFWEKEKISSEELLSMVRQCKIEGFYYLVTGICVEYLGLPMECVPWMEGRMPEKERMERLLEDMFLGGEFGECDSSRMLAVEDRKLGYFKELHRQMLLRFHRAGKVPLFWPFLWAATGIIFLYNNKHLRNTSALDIIKSARERGKLLEDLKLFEDWES